MPATAGGSTRGQLDERDGARCGRGTRCRPIAYANGVPNPRMSTIAIAFVLVDRDHRWS